LCCGSRRGHTRLVSDWSSDVCSSDLMEGRRDGFLSIQVAGKDLLVQTRAGLVVRLDAETGRAHWRQRVGRPFQGGQGLAFNKRRSEERRVGEERGSAGAQDRGKKDVG